MDEIVTTLTAYEWDYLREILNDRYLKAKGPEEARVKKLLHSICHNADKLSLKWLDEKRAEFP